MFSNNILIERLSNRFKISEKEIKDSIQYIFSEIASLVVDGKVFYMYDLGFIYADKEANLIFRNADIAFDASLETITIKYLGRTAFYEAIFETMRHIIDNGGIIYIEDFGTFSYKDGYVHFDCSDSLSYLIEERFDKVNKITSTILTKKLSSRFKKSKTEVIDLINQLFKKITLSVIDSKVFHIYDLGFIYVDKNCKLVFRSADIGFDESINDIADTNNKKEMYETILETIRHAVDNGEKVYIECFGAFFYNDGYIKFEPDEILLYVVDKRFNIKKLINNISNELDGFYSDKNILESKTEKYKSMKEYTESELLDINNFEKDFFSNENIKKSKKAINKGINIAPVLITAIFIVAIAFITVFFITYPNSNKNLIYGIDNKKLENIVDEYFNNIDSKELLTYKLTSDMYYWDISKELYDDFTYWALIYPYNKRYKADAIIKKGSSIRYKDIRKNIQSQTDSNETPTIEDIKYFYNTLSKSFLLLYPDFISAKKDGHALWTLKLSYYYDKNVFMTNSNIVPDKVYSNVLANNDGMGSFYSQFSKYNKLNGNIVSSFMAVIK
ncbi:hypothetical protein [Brachyspira catarrhinii]|uniref:Uncharacterized protein n=1 Tax=Brachyspira catarrhinii TaxID=2528966 RepID=A0ABY2TW27_9SPIR|nr:hypothetical protein [Brachyspira catarrhinii]TKZ35892.1 hypothetical protein EZH24_02925 [Brachyspira catarrhinii]